MNNINIINIINNIHNINNINIINHNINHHTNHHTNHRVNINHHINNVTNHINDLVALSMDERNFIAQQFLQWFVSEQLEEVSTMSELLDTVRHAGEANLLMVEDYVLRLGQRIAAHEAGAEA